MNYLPFGPVNLNYEKKDRPLVLYYLIDHFNRYNKLKHKKENRL